MTGKNIIIKTVYSRISEVIDEAELEAPDDKLKALFLAIEDIAIKYSIPTDYLEKCIRAANWNISSFRFETGVK